VKPDRLQVLAGADAQTEYQWVPPGRPASFLHYHLCKTRGIRAFGVGGDEPAFFFVAVASLDDADREELAAAPLRFVDGRDDRRDRAPTDTRLL
jgi:hypothetical protein